MRWATISLCTLAISLLCLVDAIPARAAPRPGTARPALTLASQTPWVTSTAPWFSLALGVGSGTGPLDDLRVNVTFYGRITSASQLAQSTSSLPDDTVLARETVAVSVGPFGRVATTCTTVLPSARATPPAPAPGTVGACPAGSPEVSLDCTPETGVCPDVYPVSVALLHKGSNSPVSRFTTFLTYEETLPVSPSGPLRVGWIVPVTTPSSGALSSTSRTYRRAEEGLTGLLSLHRGVALTLVANPANVTNLVSKGGSKGRRAVAQLAALTSQGSDQLLEQPYVPIDLAALSAAGLTTEINAQMDRGTSLLRQAGLHPAPGPWVDTASSFSSAHSGSLALGLRAAHADRLILNDDDLTPAGSDQLTFAQPFTLSLGHGVRVVAAGADSQIDSRFTADPANPVLAANQLLASLAFVHFENPFKPDHRGVIIAPPASWRPSDAFVTTLLDGMTDNPVLSAVTLDQFFDQVPEGGNQEPAARHLVSGSVPQKQTIPAPVALRLATARAHLRSFSAATSGHPAVLTTLSDLLLHAEDRNLLPARRNQALAVYTRRFDTQLSTVSLAAERTVTFTSRTAPIPITVLSSSPFPLKVVVSLNSDKFAFPDGSSRTLVLNRTTTPVRIQARARTSGDRLPVEVTVTTPDRDLVIARTAVTVHSTSISLVGVALTVLAGLVLLVWWVRTWRKGRRRRPLSR